MEFDPKELRELDVIIEQGNQRITLQQHLIVQQQEHFYCDYKKSNPVYFWQAVVRKFPTSEPLKKLIKSAIVIPLGSADAERSFSELNLIKTKHKSRMKLPQINSVTGPLKMIDVKMENPFLIGSSAKV